MPTNPTKRQVKVRDTLADALFLIAEAARLDDHVTAQATLFTEIAIRLRHLSSVFSLEEIVARALERRGLALGLAPSTAEMLTLVESEVKPLEMLLLDDDAFRELGATLDEE